MFHVRLRTFVCLPLLLAVPLSASAAVLRVNGSSPGQTPDGASWASAFGTITAALAVSSTGDEVWVAAGVYPERIVLQPAISLFGGFAGGETLRDQRDPRANVTTLDARADYLSPGRAVTITGGGPSDSTVDGFTITGGVAVRGGGIYCSDQAAPTISGNVISGNLANQGGGICASNSSPSILGNRIERNEVEARSYYGPIRGGGIYVEGGSPRIERNLIRENTAPAGGGISVLDDATVANNAIVGNTATAGGGIHVYGRATIVNNTFLDNAAGYNGGALFFDRASVTLANNVIAFNSWDYSGDSSVKVVAAANCVYANGDGERYASSPIRSSTDVKADPRVRKGLDGYPHILPDSPCRDTGLDAYVTPGDRDMEGQPRVQGARVDIGADESDGSAWPTFPRVIRVNSATGDDGADGASWGTAVKTLAAAVREAGRSGGEVWVAAGDYAGPVTLPYQVALYGGFAGDEDERDKRDPRAHVARIAGGGDRGVVYIPVGTRDTAILDGLTVADGPKSGVLVDAASAQILNNVVTGNQSIGIYTVGLTTTRIHGNTITANGSFGIGCGSYASPVISNNLVSHNAGDAWSGGIFSGSNATPRIVNNLVAHNGNPATKAGGIYVSAGPLPMTVANNTVVENTGAGITVEYYGGVTLANNIVAFNDRGITQYMAVVALSHNCVFGNADGNYGDLAPGATDIHMDPLFADRALENYHIPSDSPCANAGDAAFIGDGETDMDGDPRILGPAVDIGADEAAVLDGITMVELRRLLGIVGGMAVAGTEDLNRFDLADRGSARLDLRDAAHVLRRALGM